MKRLSSMFLAAAMVVGAFASTGCAKLAEQASQIEPAAAAPVDDGASAAPADATPATTDENANVTADAAVQVQVPAPPPLRAENPGKAPSAQHRFQPGFWRYDGARTGYVWVPGHWERVAVAPTAPPPPRVERPGRAPSAAYAYVPGYWSYDGRAYVWISGHWSLRADVGRYYRSDYVLVNGRYERRLDRWDNARFAAQERAARERAERAARERAEHERAERAARERAEHEAEHARTNAGSHGNPGVGHVRPAAPVKPIAKVATTTVVKRAATPVVVKTRKPAGHGRG